MRRTLALACGLACLVLPASAGAAITTTNDAPTLAGTLGGGSVVTGASFVELPPSGTPHGTGDTALAGFPNEGGTFAVLTTGNAAFADDPNDNEGTGAADGGGRGHGFAGATGNAQDTSVLQINLNVPVGATCLQFDFRFLSDEFEENVGSSVNDGFLAMLDNPGGTADPNGDISAPTNFAFDQNGALVSINTASRTTTAAAGTTYDAATELLTASSSITPGAHILYLAIFDQGDQALDSAAFVDNLRFSDLNSEECPQTVDRDNPAVTLTAPANGSGQNETPVFGGQAGTGMTDSQIVTVQVYAGPSVSGTPVEVLSGTPDSLGAYAIGSSGLEPGTYTAQAHQTDTAGNLGVSATTTFTVAGDSAAPVLSVDSPADGDVIGDTTPTISGTAGTADNDFPSISVNVYEGAGTAGEPVQETGTVADGDAWSVTLEDELADGQYTVQASQSDSAGNTGLSAPVTFTVDTDTAAPTVLITSPANGSSTGDTTPTLSGSAGTAPGDSSEVRVILRSGGSVVQSLVTQRNGGAWSVDAGALAPGGYTATATQADDSDNLGVSPAVSFTVNAPPPPPPPPPTPEQGVAGTVSQEPEPVLGESVVGGAVSGTVRIRLKDGSFRVLGADEEIPLGSTVDATKGKVKLTSVAGPGGKVQSGVFYSGAFVVTQTRGKKPVTQLALNGALSCPKGNKASSSAGKKVRRLWGDGKGAFRTRGRHGAATVRGTRWLTEDRCDSTKITVKRGTVVVRDFIRRKNKIVKQGQSYVARAKAKKKESK